MHVFLSGRRVFLGGANLMRSVPTPSYLSHQLQNDVKTTALTSAIHIFAPRRTLFAPRMSFRSCRRAVAALRADEEFQSDINDPRVAAAISDVKKSNNLERWAGGAAALSMWLSFPCDVHCGGGGRRCGWWSIREAREPHSMSPTA